MSDVSSGDAPEFCDRYVHRDEARARFGDDADAYARAQRRGDPGADALVAWLASEGPAGRAAFESALRTGLTSVPGKAPALARFFEEATAVPSWLDPAQLAVGARAYQRVGPSTLMILSAWSLMNGYHSAPAVKPLAFTGALEGRAPRRLAETGRFVTEVSQIAGMSRFAPGFEITVRVRRMHAAVRAALRRDPRWDAQAWGAPINQADMLGTVLEFSVLWLWGAARMGFRLAAEEREAVMHLWRYVGFVMGVEPALLAWIDSVERAERTAALVFLVQPGPDEDSRALAAALRAVTGTIARSPLERLQAPFLTRLHDGLTRAFNGDAMADALGIPNPAWRHALGPLRGVVGALEQVRARVPFGTALATELGNRRVRARVARLLEHDEPSFEPHGAPLDGRRRAAPGVQARPA